MYELEFSDHIGVFEYAELLEASYTAGGNVRWYQYFRKQFGTFLKIKTYNYNVTQPLLS